MNEAVVLHPERLAARADSLDAIGANGIRLGYVTLDATDPPLFAWLDVEFMTAHGLAPLPPAAAFVVSGGVRGHRARVRVTEVHADPDGRANALRLKVEPVGDYSTCTLTVARGTLGPPDDALPAAMDPLFNGLPFKFRPGCFNLNCAPPPRTPPPADGGPAIDLLARDYDSFRHLMMGAIAARVPGWSPTSEADLDQVLIDLVAARGDELADRHDRVMAERAIGTARRRVSLARHARLVDDHLHQGRQATATIAIQVAAGPPTDLPPAGSAAWIVCSGSAWNAADAVVFAAVADRPRWRRRVFAELNELRLYTWGGAVSALPKGATSADLTIAGSTAPADAARLQDLLRGVAAEQTGAPADVDAAVDAMLIEEVLNPETGRPNGRRVAQRQKLRLLPGADRATAIRDPVSGDWFCRVRWSNDDALDSTYCFTVDCGPVVRDDATVFVANLAELGHGRPRQTTFVAPGEPLAAVDDTGPVARHTARWQPLQRPAGSGHVAAGAVAMLPRDPAIEPLAWRDVWGGRPPGGDVPPVSTLVVEVDGTRWDERIDLIASDGSEEHYRVEAEADGRCRLRFGDGVNGAPLPAAATVVCRYQTGDPIAGNVGADTLVTSSVPLGAGGRLWNPFDITGGTAPESRDVLVRRAPEGYRQRQRRAVTLADYAAEAERIAGVAHAAARYSWCGSWRVVTVAIDPVGGGAPSADLVSRLAAALDAVRLIGDDVEIRAATPVPLDIHIVLCANADYWIEDLRAVLDEEFSDGWTADGRRGFFHPDDWTFGQPLHASQLIGRALAVTGVDRALRVSMRRFNPGAGGGLVTVVLDPASLPQPTPAVLAIGAAEIVVVANDPDHLERGRIAFEFRGGRR